MSEIASPSKTNWLPIVIAAVLVLALLAVCGVFSGCLGLFALFLLLTSCST
jgi:hypothetical protein